jgi:hypothetical protein
MRHKDLLPCPLCGRHAEIVQPIRGKGRAWNVGCGDGIDSCGLVLFGSNDLSRRDMIDHWNNRPFEGEEDYG